MVFVNSIFLIISAASLAGCVDAKTTFPKEVEADSAVRFITSYDTVVQKKEILPAIVYENVTPDSILAFAKTLIGIPYLYASTDPAMGFDCSGFITYVFNHFNIKVPRSSVDFTNYGTEIPVDQAKAGDLILFTGTDSTIRIVGHMGIVESVTYDQLNFIHSTSGKAKGVTISPLGEYYKRRFVKVIRIF